MAQTITNDKFPSQLAQSLGYVYGPIVSLTPDPNAANQYWNITKEPGSDTWTIQNQGTSTYASVPNEESGGAIILSPDPYPWVLKPGPAGTYHIATVNKGYVWYIDVVDNYYPLLLLNPSYSAGTRGLWRLKSN